MQLLDDYFSLQRQIYDYFGYIEDWVVIPIADSRQMFWSCDGSDVCFARTEYDLKLKSGEYYQNTVYQQRFLPKWVYEGEEYTMICVDTHTNGNKFLQVFSNANRREVDVCPTVCGD